MNNLVLQKISNGLSGALAASIMFMGGIYVYSMFFEDPYLHYAPMPFPITEKVYPGAAAVALATRCNSQKTTLSYRTTRTLIPEDPYQKTVVLPGVEVTADPGCTTVSTRVNVVPIDTPMGFYRFAGVATVPGLMIDHKVNWNTEIFEVVQKP